MKIRETKLGLAAAAATLALIPAAGAQSADALLDKLVEKGVLTTKEAQELRQETDEAFAKSYQVKTGLPDWVTTLKLSGDVRARFEAFNAHIEDADGNDLFKDRTRFRYRARIGAVATLVDHLEAGIRFTSSEPRGDFGGDPISGNTTWQDNASFKSVYLDRAYGKWSPTFGDLSVAFTAGKMENPFVVSDMVFDTDYSPEGLAVQLGYNLDDRNSLKFNTAYFALDEISGDSDDPYLLGAQARWDSKLTKAVQLTFGLSAFLIDNEEALTDTAVPDVNRGNSRTGGVLTTQFNPIVADAGITYNLDSFPAYQGAFPIRASAEYLNNLAESDRNQAWGLGLNFGKTGKKGLWELAYRYKYVSANSWFEEFEESDFGALRPTVTAGELTSVTLAAGTNLRGHVFRVGYSPSDAITLNLAYFYVDVISSGGAPNGDDLDAGRVQVDALWRF